MRNALFAAICVALALLGFIGFLIYEAVRPNALPPGPVVSADRDFEARARAESTIRYLAQNWSENSAKQIFDRRMHESAFFKAMVANLSEWKETYGPLRTIAGKVELVNPGDGKGNGSVYLYTGDGKFAKADGVVRMIIGFNGVKWHVVSIDVTAMAVTSG